MKEFSTALLREKFVIYDPEKGKENGAAIALSNRLAAELRDSEGRITETLVVRAQTMHSAVRMVARIVQAFRQGGPLSIRQEGYDWKAAWDAIISDYEYIHNPERWIAVYHDGKCIFSEGERHPFLDMIEKCDRENDLDYDFSIPMAEKLFVQTGKPLKIEHNSNVAMSVHFAGNTGRLGIILRSPARTTTFTFTAVNEKEKTALNIPQCLSAAAAFLEGVQLSFFIGTNAEKISLGLIERFSKEEKQTKEARKRIQRLKSEIENLERTFSVRYRPERPEFQLLILEASALVAKTHQPPPPAETQQEERQG